MSRPAGIALFSQMGSHSNRLYLHGAAQRFNLHVSGEFFPNQEGSADHCVGLRHFFVVARISKNEPVPPAPCISLIPRILLYGRDARRPPKLTCLFVFV